MLESRRLLDGGPPYTSFDTETLTLAEGAAFYVGVSCYGIGPGQAVTVNYTIENSSASSDDYEAPAGTLTLIGGYGSAFGSVQFPIKRDNLVEGNETFTLRMTSVSMGTAGHAYPPASGTSVAVTIVDDPPIVSIEAIDADATENAEGEDADPAVFRVSRTGGNVQEALTVALEARGTATAGEDYSLPAGVTIPAGQSFVDVTMNVIDDPDAEGEETIVVDLSDPGPTGNYLLAAPHGTGTATAQAVNKDNPSVEWIKVEVIPRPANLEPRYPQSGNTYYGYAFYVKMTIKGEALSKVAITQQQQTSTSIWDFDGTPITGQAWEDYFRNTYGPEYKKELLDSGGTFVTDDKWGWARLRPLDGTNDGKAEEIDAQSFGLKPLQVNYNYLASVSRQFLLKTKNDVTGAALLDQDWSYVWSNSLCTWRSTDNPPAPVTICAGSNQNGGKGRFTDIGNLLGLEAMN